MAEYGPFAILAWLQRVVSPLVITPSSAPDDARRDVAKLIGGDFGSMDWGASVVAERAGVLTSVTIMTRDRVVPLPLAAGEAFLAFSMTAPAWKR